jgi:hypothetical protein
MQESAPESDRLLARITPVGSASDGHCARFDAPLLVANGARSSFKTG